MKRANMSARCAALVFLLAFSLSLVVPSLVHARAGHRSRNQALEPSSPPHAEPSTHTPLMSREEEARHFRAFRASLSSSLPRRRLLQTEGGPAPPMPSAPDSASSAPPDPSDAFHHAEMYSWQDQWKPTDTNLHTFYGSKSLPWIPLADPYVLSDNVPWLDLTNLRYTERDWQRWDSFDSTKDLYYKPTAFGSDKEENEGSRIWGIGNGRTNPIDLASPSGSGTTPLTPETYRKLFTMQHANQYWGTGYNWFRYFAYGPYDILDRLVSQNVWNVAEVMMNTSYALNENYNIYRKSKYTELQNNIVAQLKAKGVDPATVDVDKQVADAFDALDIDFRTIKRNNYTIAWIEAYLNRFLDIQELNHTIIERGHPWGNYDSFGLFKNNQGFGKGVSQFSHFFLAPTMGLLYGYYLKLLSSETLRRIRTAMYASLSASYGIYLLDGIYENHSSCQWLLHVTSFSTHSYILLKSEDLLRARGDWRDSDGFTVSDWRNGKWTNADHVSWSEFEIEEFVNRTQKWGFMEFNSPYYGMSMEAVAFSMLLAPSQRAYDLYEKIYKAHMFDLALNFHPGSGTFSGPSGRSYDLFDGAHAGQDAYDLPQYMQHLFQPYCQANSKAVLWNGTTATSVVSACASIAPSMVRPSANPNVPMMRILYATKQAAGQGYMPFDALVNATLQAPYRTLRQIFSGVKGQERYNFITPYYQIGWAGEDYVAIPDSINVCARLSGLPVPGAPVAIVTNGDTYSTSFVRIFHEISDMPFYRSWTYDVAGMLQQIHSRHVHTQYQSFLLTTSFLSGRHYFKTPEQQAPWNTDLVFPINVDALYADNYKLPMSVNSTVAIPPTSLFTIRHQNASIVIRVLYFERSPDSDIPDAQKITPILGKEDLYQPGVGKQEHSMTWQVDSYSVQAGVGRVTIHHKHRSTTDIKMRSYRVVTLWAAGITRNDAEMYALQRMVRRAKFTQSFRFYNGWDASNQPWNESPAGRSIWSTEPAGDCDWKVGVNVGGVDLRVERHDQYTPWGGGPQYSMPANGPLHVPPFWTVEFNRTANGKDILSDAFDGNNKNKPRNGAAGPFVWTNHPQAEVAQPHLTNPVPCVPGEDFPCYQWNPHAWSACSVSCGVGTQVRGVQCADMSNFNQQTQDLSLCAMSPQVPTQQACDMGPCGTAPPAPSITKVTVFSQHASIAFSTSATTSSAASTSSAAATTYTVTASPGGMTASGSSSPIDVRGLTNGVSYTFTVKASNSFGESPASPASTPVVPDTFSWVYTAWGSCSAPCGSGTQTRTATCTGSAVGATTADKCATPMPTDLSESCNVQACTWTTGSWSTCSAPCSSGTQTRTVSCTNGLTPSTPVASSLCPAASQPASAQACNTQSCVWVTGQFSACNVACGGGSQTRTVSCGDGLGGSPAASVCTAAIGAAPSSTQACATQPCVTYQWRQGSWSTCSQTCGGGTQTRQVDCVTSSGAVAADSNCVGTKPSSTQSCGTAACTWFTGAYSSCSQPCNTGAKTRTVLCQDGAGTTVPATQCTGTAPSSTAACNTQACVVKASGFGACSASCGGGTRTQTVSCTDGTAASAVVASTYCAGQALPPTSEVCSTQACPTVPSAPTITSITASDGRVLVAFSAPAYTGGSPITGYNVLLNPGGVIISGASSPISVPAQNGVSVTAQVSAANAVGYSAYSAASQSVTPFGVPTAPVISSVVVGDGSLTVLFVPATQAAGAPATTFELSASPNGQIVTGAASPLQLTGLTNGAAYTIALVAVNPIGRSVAVVPPGTYTPATVPSAPSITNVSPGNQQVSVSFTAPSNGGSAIVSYTAVSTPGGVRASGSSSPLLVKGLTNGQTYTFQVFASNSIGDGRLSPASLSVMPAAPVGVPSAPLSVSAVTAGSGSARVSFSPPLSTGGAAITSYTVTATPVQETVSLTTLGAVVRQAFGASSPITVGSLVNGVRYTFTVTASNAAGASVASQPSAALQVVGPPSAPTITSVSGASGLVSLRFTPPLTDGGSPIISYSVTSSPGGAITTGYSSPITIRNLKNGMTFTFTLTARNVHGNSAPSAPSAPVKPSGPPAKPLVTSVAAMSGAAMVTFAAPEEDGGSPITSYTVVSSPGGLTAVSPTEGTVSIDGLANGQSYTFAVMASNASGSSDLSEASAAVTPADVPSAPVVSSVEAGDAQVTVYFSTPNDNGQPITSYTVTSQPPRASVSGSSSPLVVKGLVNGQSYTFSVVATNSVGAGAASAPSASVAPVASPPPPPPKPAAPIIGEATLHGSTVRVAFSANSSSTVAAISYTVTSSPGALTAMGTTSPIALTNLEPGVSYTFTVQANGANAVSPPSAPSNLVVVPLPHWSLSGFGPCSQSCDGGIQTQTVLCVDAAGAPVEDNRCANAKPASSMICNTQPCANWLPSDWSQCSVNCGGGVQTRTFVCADKSGNSLDASLCAELPKPLSGQSCNTQVCVVDTPAPTIVHAGPQSVTLGWSVEAETVQYVVRMSAAGPNDESSFKVVYRGPGPTTSIGELDRQTTYYFQLKLDQAAAVWSPVVQTTTQLGLPAAPTALDVRPLSDTSVSVDWIDPVDNGGSPILSYQVEYTEQAEFVPGASMAPKLNERQPGDGPVAEGAVLIETQTIVVSSHPVILRDLKPHTTYSFAVRAKTAVGLGDAVPAPGDAPKLLNTFTTTPSIVSAVAWDPSGLNGQYAPGSAIDITFDRDTNGPSIAQSPESIVIFSQKMGSLKGIWLDAHTLTLVVVSVPADGSVPSIGSLKVSVDPFANLQSADGLSVPCTSAHFPVTGSFGNLHGVNVIHLLQENVTQDAPYAPFDQSILFALEEGTPALVAEHAGSLILDMEIMAPAGASFHANDSRTTFSVGGTMPSLEGQASAQRVYFPPGFSGQFMVMIKLSTPTGELFDSAAYLAYVLPVNHPPSIAAHGAPEIVAPNVWADVGDSIPAITDVDAERFPSAPFRVTLQAPEGGQLRFSQTVQMVTYAQTYDVGASTRVITGPLVWVNEALKHLQLRVMTEAAPDFNDSSYIPQPAAPITTTLTLTLDDQNNGQEVPARPLTSFFTLSVVVDPRAAVVSNDQSDENARGGALDAAYNALPASKSTWARGGLGFILAIVLSVVFGLCVVAVVGLSYARKQKQERQVVGEKGNEKVVHAESASNRESLAAPSGVDAEVSQSPVPSNTGGMWHRGKGAAHNELESVENSTVVQFPASRRNSQFTIEMPAAGSSAAAQSMPEVAPSPTGSPGMSPVRSPTGSPGMSPAGSPMGSPNLLALPSYAAGSPAILCESPALVREESPSAELNPSPSPSPEIRNPANSPNVDGRGTTPHAVPGYGELTYPESFQQKVPPLPVSADLPAGSSSQTSAGRIFYYLNGQRQTSSGAASRSGSVAGSVTGSRHASASSSRVTSRRVSPERNLSIKLGAIENADPNAPAVHIPAGSVQLSPTLLRDDVRRLSFAIDEVRNEAAAKLAGPGNAQMSQATREALARRGSSQFAHLEQENGSSFYGAEQLSPDAPDEADPSSRLSGPHSRRRSDIGPSSSTLSSGASSPPVSSPGIRRATYAAVPALTGNQDLEQERLGPDADARIGAASISIAEHRHGGGEEEQPEEEKRDRVF